MRELQQRIETVLYEAEVIDFEKFRKNKAKENPADARKRHNDRIAAKYRTTDVGTPPVETRPQREGGLEDFYHILRDHPYVTYVAAELTARNVEEPAFGSRKPFKPDDMPIPKKIIDAAANPHLDDMWMDAFLDVAVDRFTRRVAVDQQAQDVANMIKREPVIAKEMNGERPIKVIQSLRNALNADPDMVRAFVRRYPRLSFELFSSNPRTFWEQINSMSTFTAVKFIWNNVLSTTEKVDMINWASQS